VRSTAIFTGLRTASADIVNTFAAQLLRAERPPKRPSGPDGYRRCTNRRTRLSRMNIADEMSKAMHGLF
jgi:hypothetical protein